MLCVTACGDGGRNFQRDYQALSAIESAPLRPGVETAIKVAGNGDVPVLEISFGRLPEGLKLHEDGFIRGTPRMQGEVRRFSIRSVTPRGEPLEERDYTLAVGVGTTTLALPAEPTRQGEAITFDGLTWNRPIASAYAWDEHLGLVWPLKGSSSISGKALASPSGALDLIVSASDAQGRFPITQTPLDTRLEALAQLTWDGDSNIDLVQVPEPTISIIPVTEATPAILDGIGQWIARHEIASKGGPGAEVVSLAKGAPPGRYSLVALKREGGEIRTQLWLTVKHRDGETIALRRFDSLFSDIASGTIVDELAGGRQSFKLLGTLTVTAEGVIEYSLPPGGTELFPSAEVSE